VDITEVAQHTGLTASTLRFYEEKELIASIGRRGLHRVFDPRVLERLALIALGRSAGFSLDEIAPLHGHCRAGFINPGFHSSQIAQPRRPTETTARTRCPGRSYDRHVRRSTTLRWQFSRSQADGEFSTERSGTPAAFLDPGFPQKPRQAMAGQRFKHHRCGSRFCASQLASHC